MIKPGETEAILAINTLRLITEEKGISQAELARRINKKPNYISTIFSHTQFPTLPNFLAIAKAAGIEFEMKEIDN